MPRPARIKASKTDTTEAWAALLTSLAPENGTLNFLCTDRVRRQYRVLVARVNGQGVPMIEDLTRTVALTCELPYDVGGRFLGLYEFQTPGAVMQTIRTKLERPDLKLAEL